MKTKEDRLSNLPVRSDMSLLRRFRLGSEDAATELYRRYAPRLRRLARRECSSSSLAPRVDADDIVQSVFCAFFQAVRKGYYDVPDGEDLWKLLLVIALNKVRTKKTFHQAAKRDFRQTISVQGARARCQPDDANRQLLRIAFEDALFHLGRPERQMVALLMEGWQVAEIAAKVGRSKRTIERNLQAARQGLRRLLEREFCHDE
jgi:RNA polymerase sigma-70 factor, ECF subfamily